MARLSVLLLLQLLASASSQLLAADLEAGPAGPGAAPACAPCDPSGGPAKGACLLACEAARTLNEKWLQEAKGEWEDTQFWASGNAVQVRATHCSLISLDR